jgi:hypothetical protein
MGSCPPTRCFNIKSSNKSKENEKIPENENEVLNISIKSNKSNNVIPISVNKNTAINTKINLENIKEEELKIQNNNHNNQATSKLLKSKTSMVKLKNVNII